MSNRLSRFNLRLSFRDFTLFFMLSKTQTLSGIISDCGNKEHFVLWDIEGCSKEQCALSLIKVQQKYDLGTIYVLSDRINSYGAMCFSRVDFNKLLRILIDTEYIDDGFISYTAERHKATLRLSQKKDRGERELIYTIPNGKINPVIGNIKSVVYDTGMVKEGLSLRIGG